MRRTGSVLRSISSDLIPLIPLIPWWELRVGRNRRRRKVRMKTRMMTAQMNQVVLNRPVTPAKSLQRQRRRLRLKKRKKTVLVKRIVMKTQNLRLKAVLLKIKRKKLRKNRSPMRRRMRMLLLKMVRNCLQNMLSSLYLMKRKIQNREDGSG
jgi:hypothetical protein